VTGQTRKHVATLKQRDCDSDGPAHDRSGRRALALHPNRDRAHRGATGPRTARSPSHHEEANYSGILTPNRCTNYAGGTDEQGLIVAVRTLNNVYRIISPKMSGRQWNILQDWDAKYGTSLGTWRDALKKAIARLRTQSALDANEEAGCSPCEEAPNLP